MTAHAIPSPFEITAPALTLPATTTFDQWISTGKSLSSAKRHLDWLIGDWLCHGRRHFPDQIELALEYLEVEPRQIKRIEKTVEAFPAHLRHKSLSFDHHAHVADLPAEEALPLLRQAQKDHMPARQLRIKAMLKKVEKGLILPREEDAEDDALVAMCRAWNRAPVSAREEFADMIAESHLGIIDP